MKEMRCFARHFHTNPDYCIWTAEDGNKRKVAEAEIIDRLGNGNLVDVTGEAYHFGDKWYMVKIKRDSGYVQGYVSARYLTGV